MPPDERLRPALIELIKAAEWAVEWVRQSDAGKYWVCSFEGKHLEATIQEIKDGFQPYIPIHLRDVLLNLGEGI